MRSNLMRKLIFSPRIAFLITLMALLSPTAGINAKGNSGSAYQQRDVSFSLTRLPEDPRRYSLIVSDDEEHVISGTFSINQLQILRMIMGEAEKFAMNGEAVGSSDPLTTRFKDANEAAFMVDVEKLGPQSRLYFTLETEIGRATFDAGRVFRATQRKEGIFVELLSRLGSMLPKLPAQSAK